MFRLFSRTPTSDRLTDIYDYGIYRASMASRGKNQQCLFEPSVAICVRRQELTAWTSGPHAAGLRRGRNTWMTAWTPPSTRFSSVNFLFFCRILPSLLHVGSLGAFQFSAPHKQWLRCALLLPVISSVTKNSLEILGLYWLNDWVSHLKPNSITLAVSNQLQTR